MPPPVERKKIDLKPLHDAKVPILFILGGPGSGKGTQCAKIKEKYGFSHLSSGDLLRDELKSGSDRAKELGKIMEAGELVPLEVVLDLVKEAMVDEIKKGSKGFLIDGYPREVKQGQQFEQEIQECKAVIYFHVSEEVMMERIIHRGKTSGRADDNVETIRKRVNTFNTQTVPVVAYYKEKNKLIQVDAFPGSDEVFAAVVPIMDKLVAH